MEAAVESSERISHLLKVTQQIRMSARAQLSLPDCAQFYIFHSQGSARPTLSMTSTSKPKFRAEEEVGREMEEGDKPRKGSLRNSWLFGTPLFLSDRPVKLGT